MVFGLIGTVACAEFILAGAEIFFRVGRKKNEGGADSRPKVAKNCSAPPIFFSAPPAEFDSAPPAEFNSGPGAEQTRGGAENLIIPRERG